MKTQVKQYGGSTVVVLNKEFLKYHNLKVGDWLDISDVVKTNPNDTQLKREVKK